VVVTAVINPPGVTGSPAISFQDVIVKFTPPEGSSGAPYQTTVACSHITINAGSGTCGTAVYDADLVGFNITAFAASPSKMLLSSASVVAPFDLAGYKAQL
jgi:hypothetical protein